MSTSALTQPGETPPSVAILSSASGGGAGIAARRLCDALNASGTMLADFIEVAVIGQTLPSDVAIADSLSNRTISDTHFTVEHPGFARGWMVEMLASYDLINVHWASYLVSLTELHMLAEMGKPMLFMMHDFHYMTGGCHYPATCDQLDQGCVSCPQVDRSRCEPRVIQNNLKIKHEIFSYPNVHMMAPSRYLRTQAVQSGLVPRDRAHVLGNVYEPLEETRISTDPNQMRVLLIADTLTERRKQMRLAARSLGEIRRLRDEQGLPLNLSVEIVGTSSPELETLVAQSGLPYKMRGRISDHAQLTGILAETELLLTCSNEDNWPNILVEAGSYGCMPVVGPGHGCEEFVHRFSFGEVATAYSETAFAKAFMRAVATRDPELSAKAAIAIRAAHRTGTVLTQFGDITRRVGVEINLATSAEPVA